MSKLSEAQAVQFAEDNADIIGKSFLIKGEKLTVSHIDVQLTGSGWYVPVVHFDSPYDWDLVYNMFSFFDEIGTDYDLSKYNPH